MTEQGPLITVRFSIRGLLVATFVVAAFVAVGVYLRSLAQPTVPGQYRSFDQWPTALRRLTEKNLQLREHVEPFGLEESLDHRSIWKIEAGSVEAGSALLDSLKNSVALVPTSSDHPKAQ